MKRIGLKRMIAMLLCAALCLTGTMSALAEATPSEATPKQFTAKAVGGENKVDVTIEGASDLSLKISLLNAQGQPAANAITHKGNGKVSFDNVPAGTFSVVVNYATAVDGIKPVTVKDVAVVDPVSADPTDDPAANPTADPTTDPSDDPTADPTDDPTADPTDDPTANPTDDPTANPTDDPTANPTDDPTANPTDDPTANPTDDPTTAPVDPITMTVTSSGDTVTVNITSASAMPVVVKLMLGSEVKETKTIASGVGTVTFSGIAAGNYTVVAEYESLPGSGVTAQESVAVTGKTAPIAITQVNAGENQLVVTGTAQPNTDVTLTTDPASTTTVVKVDASGKFTATITAAAGTYTAVHAQYGSDTASRVTASGSFVVTAPATKPELTVDAITPSSLTVLARTTPGVVVNLATSDYGQTVTADSRGILRYSLPHTYPKGTVVTFTVYYGQNNALSFQQTVTVGGPSNYPLLKRGDKNTWVFDLTTRLVELGYLKDPTIAFNDTVVAAVRYFQTLNGLSVDGIVGPLTWRALYSVAAIAAGEVDVYPVLVRGDRGLALIYTLQQRLKDLGYYTIRVDGIFGSGTQRAVREFQMTNGLAVTGKADNATQQLLYSSAAKPAGWYGGSNYGTLSRSSRYQAAVVPLQRRLKDLGYYSGSIDGYFGSQTQRAVRNFQSRNGISCTGVADAYTQEVLFSADAISASGGSSSGSTSTGYRLLYWGCKGDAVKRLQQALLDAGYKQVRTADGIFGQWTYDGVRAYQKDHGLAVDGIAGKKTQNSLYGTNY